MLQNFVRAVENNVPVNIFGCTNLGSVAYDIIRQINISSPITFIDNSPEKQQRLFLGEKVYGLKQKKVGQNKEYYIIASFSFCDEMERQLAERNISNEYIIHPEEVSEILTVFREMPHQKIKFAVDLAEHCNLNCWGCNHFAPLAKENTTQPDDFERDMRRVSELFGENVSQIKLEGGEPLLNPHIVEFIQLTYKYFPHSVISIYTNGILLMKMDDLFWDTCSKYKVLIEVTKYPIAFDYELVYKKAQEKNVNMHYYAGGEMVKSMQHFPLDIEGNQDADRNFHSCFLANNCIMLKAGKLYTCTIIPNIEHFSRYFGKELMVTDKDGIDIYSDVTYQEIMEFLCKPVPACRYCKVADRTDGHVWKVSKKDISEWV